MLKTAVMSSKGQVVIPVAFRKRFKMKEGTTIVFKEEKGRIVMEAKNWDDLIALRGSMEAARYRQTYRLSHADAFAAALALKRKATLVSADASFERFGDKLKLLRLPAYAPNK